MLDNQINTSSAKEDQRKAFKKAMNAEKSQGAALRRIKQVAKQYDFFTLSDFQQFVLDNQNDCFGAIQSTYTKAQNRKVEQLERIKEGKELLINESYSVYYEPSKDMKVHQRTFGSKQKAEDFKDKLTLKNLSIEKSETPISTAFTPSEMLGRLHYMEGKFFETFPEAETVTIAMIKRSLSENVTKKDKEISAENKGKIDKKAA